jgi:hypothetical protein
MTKPDPNDEGEEFVVAQGGAARAFQLLARPIVGCQFLHLVLYSRSMRRRRMSSLWLFPAVVAMACANPPLKEMNQAQAALEAAEAQGAAQYAGDEYTAAVEALQRSREAVTRRDYRLALNDALDSRERAQNATRMTSGARQQDVEHLMTEVTSLIAAGHARLSAAKLANASGSLLHQVTVALTAVEADLQEAGALAEAGDYQTAQRLLNEAKSRMNLALGSLGQTSGSTRSEDTESAIHLS